MSYIQFESAREKEQARSELREAREEMLEKAKQNAEKRAERKTQELLKGKTNWILPSVAAKFVKSESKKKNKGPKKSKKLKKSKKSGNKKHKRKHTSSSSESNDSDSDADNPVKKSKKAKKSKKKRSKKYSSISSDNSSYNEGAQDEWVEKPQSDSELKRDNWMMDSAAFSLKTFSKERTDPKEKVAKPEQYDPVKSERELNPHWKTSGTGLPSFQKPKDNSDDDDAKPKRQTISSNGASTSNWRKKPANSDIQKSQKCEASVSESSSSSSDEADDKSNSNMSTAAANEFLTDQQMNELGAKILKAEILGNIILANELKVKLEKARTQRTAMKDLKKQNPEKTTNSNKSMRGGNDEHVLLTHTDKMGNSRPLKSKDVAFDSRDLYGGRKGRKKSGKCIETHEMGERVRFFPDDDKYDIKQMFEREKYTTAAESNLEFADIASKHKNPNDDLEDIFADKIRKTGKSDNKEIQSAIRSHEKLSAQLENCDKCFDSAKMNKSLIVSMGEKVYLTLPWHIGLQTGHCLIVPTQHAVCCTQLDEDTWEEMENFRKSLTRMFAAQKKDVIFFEIAHNLHRRTHLAIHCVPVPMSQGEMAPFYFKKAIEESEHEWSVNKQLVSLRREKGLRSRIPKGLPYFWVNFGMDSGFAHVIEDENRFPSNFAFEIIGGMLHLEPLKWRKPKKEQNSITKVKFFADSWKKYDCTQ